MYTKKCDSCDNTVLRQLNLKVSRCDACRYSMIRERNDINLLSLRGNRKKKNILQSNSVSIYAIVAFLKSKNKRLGKCASMYFMDNQLAQAESIVLGYVYAQHQKDQEKGQELFEELRKVIHKTKQ